MDPVLVHVETRVGDIVKFIRELVECESPSDRPEAVNRFVDLFSAHVGDIARVKTFEGGPRGKHLRCDFELPGKKKHGRILGLGHSDTVWPLGTLQAMPWREENGRLWGPGVLDMKSGLAFFVYAVRALRELDIPTPRNVSLLIVSDEEVGSLTSRALTEEEARKSNAVLVLEPGSGLDGKPKTSRKGVGGYRVSVHGYSSHAGVDFTAGASAILELARQIETISSFTNLKKGVTVNVGVVSGGTRTNVVPAEAHADIDFRVPRMSDFTALHKKFEALRPVDKRCRLEVHGELNRPPMERTGAVAKLFRTAKNLSSSVNVKLEESSTGGGSDGNFTAALGVPTLDGIGGVGEGAHADHESILINRIVDRTALLAKLLASELGE